MEGYIAATTPDQPSAGVGDHPLILVSWNVADLPGCTVMGDGLACIRPGRSRSLIGSPHYPWTTTALCNEHSPKQNENQFTALHCDDEDRF